MQNRGKDIAAPEHHHTQTAPLHLILYTIGLIEVIVSVYLFARPGSMVAAIILFFGHIVYFFPFISEPTHQGPWWFSFNWIWAIKFVSAKIFYDSVIKIESGKTLLINREIDYSLKDEWIWYLWGKDCVVMRCKKEIFQIGTTINLVW